MSPAPVLLAVNGTLMRGLKLSPNMATAGATFVRDAMTEPVYSGPSTTIIPQWSALPMEPGSR